MEEKIGNQNQNFQKFDVQNKLKGGFSSILVEFESSDSLQKNFKFLPPKISALS